MFSGGFKQLTPHGTAEREPNGTKPIIDFSKLPDN